MQVTVFTDRLNKALSLVARIVSSKSQLPVLSNVLLTAEKGLLSLSTTNLETAITTKIAAVVEKTGKTTVPVKQLAELTSLLKEEKVNLSLENNNLVIEGKKTRNSLNTTPASEFPPIVIKEGQPNLIIKEKNLREAIEQISIATSQDESRPLLGGARITQKGGKIEVAATDGYRLSVKEVTSEKQEIEKNLIMPIRTLLEVIRVAGEQKAKEAKILILGEQNQAVFIFEETEIISRLIEGEFPNFQRIIPSSFTTRVIIDKEELLNSVKMAAIFARESANIVKFSIKNKTLTLSANAPQVGENKAVLEIEKEGEDIEVAFNYRFLLEFLNIVTEERIVFETNGSLNPGVFKLEKDPSLLHIIMPVRVQS